MGCCWRLLSGPWAGGSVSGGRAPTCLGPNWWAGGRHPGPGRGFAGFALQSRGPSPHGQARKMPGTTAVPPDNMAGTVARTPAGPLCVVQRPGSLAPHVVGQAGCGCCHLHLWVTTPPSLGEAGAGLCAPVGHHVTLPGRGRGWPICTCGSPRQPPWPGSVCPRPPLSKLLGTPLVCARPSAGLGSGPHSGPPWWDMWLMHGRLPRPTPQLSTLKALVSPLWGWALTRVHHVSPGPARRHGGSGGSWPGAQRAGAALGGGTARE